jgi:hypothetical protein
MTFKHLETSTFVVAYSLGQVWTKLSSTKIHQGITNTHTSIVELQLNLMIEKQVNENHVIQGRWWHLENNKLQKPHV